MSDISVFVREALARGRVPEEIAAAMAGAGWDERAVAEEIGKWRVTEGMPPLPAPRKPAFDPATAGMLALLTCLIGWTVAAAFWTVETLMPDPAEAWTAPVPRWTIASLLVLGPAAMLFGRSRKGREAPWALALLVVAPVAALLGDAVSAVYALLAGDLSPRFLAKSAIVAGFATLVIVARRGPGSAVRRLSRVMLGVSMPLAACAVAMSGGVGQGRLERMDAARATDVSNLAREIACEDAGAADCRSGEARRSDPFTGEDYRISRQGGDVIVCFTPRSRSVAGARPAPGEPPAGCHKEQAWESGDR